MSVADTRLQKRLDALEARRSELVDEIEIRQRELREVLRELLELRSAAAIVEGTHGLRPPMSVDPHTGREVPMAYGDGWNVEGAFGEAIRKLEVGSVAYQAVLLLRTAGKPLHGNDIAAQLNALGYTVSTHTVAVTLGRMARDGRALKKVRPNTYALAKVFNVIDGPVNSPYRVPSASEQTTEHEMKDGRKPTVMARPKAARTAKSRPDAGAPKRTTQKKKAPRKGR